MTDKNTEEIVDETTIKDTKDDVSEERTQDVVSEHSAPETKSAAKGQASKIDVLLKPAGDAPIMKKKKWAVERNKHISWVCAFIKKYLKCDPTESMFLYVNQSFAPSPDSEIGTVFDCFGSDGKLVLHYCKSQAWG